MKMKHRLTGPRAYVEHGAVSVFDVALARDVGSGEVAASDKFGVIRFRFS